jgi:hypothetical protein
MAAELDALLIGRARLVPDTTAETKLVSRGDVLLHLAGLVARGRALLAPAAISKVGSSGGLLCRSIDFLLAGFMEGLAVLHDVSTGALKTTGLHQVPQCKCLA